jgi:AAA domain-containing protein
MSIALQYTDQYNPLTNGIKMLLYGPWGVGKTPLLGTAPNPCIISAEKGLLSLRRTHTAFIEITGYKMLEETYVWARDSQEAKGFFTIGLDSLTEIAEVLLNELKRSNKDPRQAFYQVQDKVVEYARAMRDLPGRSVVLVSKEEFSKDINGIQLFQPMMPGTKLGQALPYYFDEVIRMIQWPGSHERALCTKSNYQHQARDRSGMLAEFEPPDLTRLFSKILGYK